MTFKEAVDKDFPGKYKSGIQAVKGSDRDKFDFLKSSRNINGSIDSLKKLDYRRAARNPIFFTSLSSFRRGFLQKTAQCRASFR